jgi:hypothetical protein
MGIGAVALYERRANFDRDSSLSRLAVIPRQNANRPAMKRSCQCLMAPSEFIH